MHSNLCWVDGITSLIFDLDGVLIQSRNAHARAFHEVLRGYGIHDFVYDDFAGWRTAEVFREIFRGHHIAKVSDAMVAECSQRKRQFARELIAAERPIEDDCVPIVRELAGRYSLALASSGSRQSVDSFLDCTGLGDAFSSTLSGDDVIRAKPDPEIFARSIAALKAQPQECAVIEDAVAGIVAARRAGAHSIGFGNNNSKALSMAGAGLVVGSLRELACLLERE
jgi:beta-phosphoglucomutase